MHRGDVILKSQCFAFWGEQNNLRSFLECQGYSFLLFRNRRRIAARIISAITTIALTGSSMCYTVSSHQSFTTSSTTSTTSIVETQNSDALPSMLEKPSYGFGEVTVEAMRVADEVDPTTTIDLDPFASSGSPDAFSGSYGTDSFEVKDKPGKFPAISVNGVRTVVFFNAQETQWVWDKLFEGHVQPSSGGMVVGKSFVENVEVLYLDSCERAVNKEEALAILQPLIHIFVHEKVFRTDSIPFETTYIKDNSLPKNIKKVVTSGKKGQRQMSYEVVSINGVVKEEILLGTRVLSKPENEVVAVGDSDTQTKENGRVSDKDFVQITENDIPDESTFLPSESQLLLEASIFIEVPGTFESEISAQKSTSNTAETAVKNVDKTAWPSSGFSTFNYPNPTKTWFTNGKMGAGEYYPGIDKAKGNIDSREGVEGPKTNLKFGWPTSSKFVSSYFGWRKGRMHYGIDIPDKKGTPIYASENGTVTWYTLGTGKGRNGYGYVVELNHGGGFTSIYAHCDTIAVAAGDHVKKGDVIAYIGMTPDISSPHLHFEIRCDGIPYNPLLSYLK